MAACDLAIAQVRPYSPTVSIEQRKAELRAASPETQAELFILLGALRRSTEPNRQQQLNEKLDDATRWVTEEEAARRLGLEDDDR